MSKNLYSVITGTGSYIPTQKIPNRYFLNSEFYDVEGKKIEISNEETIKNFEKITGIKERRYVTNDLLTSNIASYAAENCLNSSRASREDLDYIIVAHNFGDVRADNKRSDFVPSLASRVKIKLGIKNPYTVAYDLPFGCPGWLQGIIQADSFIKSGKAKKILVIGAETLSRISDIHDRDSMIYSDGAGSALVEALENDKPVGILSNKTRSDSSYMLWMGKSNNPYYKGNELFLKMYGHDVFEYAVKYVRDVVKKSLDEANLGIRDIKKILIHQANEKMDESIVKWLFKLYGIKASQNDIQEIMPMTISWLGNSSVATLPTLLDLLMKGKFNDISFSQSFEGNSVMPEIIKNVTNNGGPFGILKAPESLTIDDSKTKNFQPNYIHKLNSGDNVVFASVGGGMNINSVVYRMP
ncbi:MAG: ketoacyl-ACP synthase III [Nanoarchaeota archaeon]|nr:ketoacyl-ACP synthase III [Nanoarchaeota archaeon]MBU1027727.1 ketoacyl-ACP synthase III [Nanoarchaeota archaeon]